MSSYAFCYKCMRHRPLFYIFVVQNLTCVRSKIINSSTENRVLLMQIFDHIASCSSTVSYSSIIFQHLAICPCLKDVSLATLALFYLFSFITSLFIILLFTSTCSSLTNSYCSLNIRNMP